MTEIIMSPLSEYSLIVGAFSLFLMISIFVLLFFDHCPCCSSWKDSNEYERGKHVRFMCWTGVGMNIIGRVFVGQEQILDIKIMYLSVLTQVFITIVYIIEFYNLRKNLNDDVD